MGTPYQAPKNLCRSCGEDFSSLYLFDLHRQSWRINRNQDLVGGCLTPGELGLTERNGTWYSDEGLRIFDRMAAARLAK